MEITSIEFDPNIWNIRINEWVHSVEHLGRPIAEGFQLFCQKYGVPEQLKVSLLESYNKKFFRK